MIADRSSSASNLRCFRALTGLCAALLPGLAAGQAVNTYLPPDVLQHGNQPRRSLVQLGLFDLNPTIATSAIYDDNISLRSDEREDDFIFVVAPGVDIFRADADQDSVVNARLTYSPAFVFFSQHGTHDSLDHFLRANGRVALSRLTIDLSQQFESSAGGIADVGSRVNQNYYLTSVRVRYDISEKTSAEIGGGIRITDYEERLIGSREWHEDNSIHYQVTPKVRLGFGVTVGQLTVDDTQPVLGSGIGPTNRSNGGTQTFVTPSVRASYRTSVKTDVSLSFGGEFRSYDDGRTRFGPVFSLTGSYAPWEYTTFSIEGHRREQNSAVLGGQDYVTTGFGVSAMHRFRTRYRARLSFTYDHAEYVSAKRGVNASRVDDYFLLRYGVDAILASSWTVGIYHQYRVNESTSGFTFDNNQVGLQSVWAY